MHKEFLNVQTNYTVKWLKLLNNILNPNDIVKNNFWYNCILRIIDNFIRYDENIIDRLTTYKNRGEVGKMSATMWSQASLLSDQDIETLGKFIEETLE